MKKIAKKSAKKASKKSTGKVTQVNVLLTPGDKAKLLALAKQAGTTMSDVLRDFINKKT